MAPTPSTPSPVENAGPIRPLLDLLRGEGNSRSWKRLLASLSSPCGAEAAWISRPVQRNGEAKHWAVVNSWTAPGIGSLQETPASDLRSAVPVFFENGASPWPELSAWCVKYGWRACGMWPVFQSGALIGWFGFSRRKDGWSDDDRRLLENAAEIVTTVLVHQAFDQQVDRLVRALDQTAETVMITDAHGDIEYTNHAFEVVTGYPLAEVRGHTPGFLKSGEHPGVFFREMWNKLLRGEVWTGLIVNRRKNGNMYRADTTITPIRNEQGAVISFISTARDITREMEIEEKFRQSQKMEALDHLASGMAHDFNNMLTPIMAYSDLALMELPGEHPVRKYLEEISGCAEQGAALIRQLLAFGRKREPDISPVEVNEIISGLETMVRRSVHENVQIELQLAPDAGVVMADPWQMEQVIVNLVLNARDAMPQGGKLTIATHGPAKTGPGAEHPSMATIEVRDTGTGIDPAIQAHIFEPFYTTKPPGEGTGLGLTSARSIVSRHGGQLTVESTLGVGSVFRLTLPAATETALPEPIRSHTTAGRGTETILLVEDDSAVRMLSAELLRRMGYTVFDFSDSGEALLFIRSATQPVHLLLADVILPHCDGRRLFQQLRSTYPRLKGLFMTGHGPQVLKKMGLSDDAKDMIRKPFTVSDLMHRVRQTLDEPVDAQAPNPQGAPS